MFFKYCESGSGAYIGISSERIQDLLLSYLANGELPELVKLENRVSLFELVKGFYCEDMSDEELNGMLQKIWATDAAVRLWYDYDFYIGMMKVYCNRLKKHGHNSAVSLQTPKERMDMGELRKYYPAYYHELKEYVFLNAEKDEEGYIYSAIQEEGEPPVRSKYRSFFEIDHIVPISKGGNTVKENLRLLSRKQNGQRGNTLEGEES